VTRLVAVSNRVAIPRRAAAAGGLAVGVLAAMRSRGGLWFGWSGDVSDDDEGVAVATRQNVEFVTFDLPRKDFELYYGGFCNGTLWPLCHYFIDALRYSQDQYEGYVRVNRRFAERLAPLLRDDDLIWVHDYHLLRLARELRVLGVAQPIGFFLHIPFPHVEALRALPRYDELVRALLEYDVVGFQTSRDLESFRSAVAAVLGPNVMRCACEVGRIDRSTRLGVFPIGVDVAGIQREARDSQEFDTVKRMNEGLRGRRCVIGVDRLDYSKGIVERFEAYEALMVSRPECQNRLTFLQIAPLSRAGLPSYATIRKSLEQTAGRINGRFAETDWTPIRYLNRNFSHEVLMGFLRNAGVCVVTPMRDGMNLVAKEFVAAQDPEDPGVLVLSTLAGAAEELTDSLLVNPHDSRAVADAIHVALNMSNEERRARHARMLEVLERNDIRAWHARFLAELRATRARQTEEGPKSRGPGQRRTTEAVRVEPRIAGSTR
jgi:trehalose 6-phosphate synthase